MTSSISDLLLFQTPEPVGFTGTQKDLTSRQFKVLGYLLLLLSPSEFHHGCCFGADTAAHYFALSNRIPAFLHPSIDDKKQSICPGATQVYLKKDYIPRNHDIVDLTKLLIATPSKMVETLRSGTWATIRYAKKLKRPVLIIYPDGTIEPHFCIIETDTITGRPLAVYKEELPIKRGTIYGS